MRAVKYIFSEYRGGRMKFLKHLWRLLVLWILLGMGYTTLELLFRGVTYVQMLWIGGLVGVLVGLLNEHPAYYNRLMWQQCLLGTIIHRCNRIHFRLCAQYSPSPQHLGL